MEQLKAFLLGVLVAAVLYAAYDFVKARIAENELRRRARAAREWEAKEEAREAAYTKVLTEAAERIMAIATGDGSDDQKLAATLVFLTEKDENGHWKFFPAARARIEEMIRQRGDQAALTLVTRAEGVLNPGGLESLRAAE